MSNAIRYDSLLVRELARELRARLSGARVDALFLDRDRLRLTLLTRAPRRDLPRTPSLHWQLHPSSGHLTSAPYGIGVGRLPLGAAHISDVTAPPDERVLMLHLGHAEGSPDGATARVVIELLTNQWNAIAIGRDERITAVLRERQTKERTLRVGLNYVAPRGSDRAGAVRPLSLAEWNALLATVSPGERLPALPRLVAYTSPQNAATIIGDADVTGDADALERAHARYLNCAWSDALRPVLLQHDGGWQPYVVPDADAATAAESLLHAFETAAERSAQAPAAATGAEDALSVIADRLEAVARRQRRLEEEQAGAAEEARKLRAQADVLISNLHQVQRGASRVSLTGFAGEPLDIELDPALSPADNAKRLYDTARRRDRAAARIPALLAAASGELERLEQLASRVRDGTASPADLERLQRARAAARRDDAPPLPYRLYRTTGGLEVRVGRGSRANDELTFRHSSPNDVWLHARDVAGAHVILRWSRADANPSSRDITEAAVLAALYSKARSSGTVPVDWTRRKYVRKPRKSAPGLVIPERVKTVFVEPDAGLEERLRAEPDFA